MRSRRRGPCSGNGDGGSGGGDCGVAGGIQDIERGPGDRLAGAHLHSVGRKRADNQGRTYRAQTPLFRKRRRAKRYKSHHPAAGAFLVHAYLPQRRTRSIFRVRPSYFLPSFYPAFLCSSLLSFPVCENASSRSVVDILVQYNPRLVQAI